MSTKEKKQELESDEIDLEKLEIKRSYQKSINEYKEKLSLKLKRFINNSLPKSKDNFKFWLKSFRGKLILLTIILVSIIPIFMNRTLYYRIFMLAMIYAIYAASWDLISGVTGQLSFGHAAFLGIGGYATAFFVKYLQVNWFIALIIGSFFGVFFGLFIAIPCLRLKGPYLALGTLVFSLLLYQLFSMSTLAFIFFGEEGISTIMNFLYINTRIRFIIVLIVMIVSVTIMLAISNSKLGTIFKAIRDDEKATEASGINIVKYKIYAFMISTFFAGIAGGLYVLDQTKVDPAIFGTLYSFYPVVMSCVGGIALISGSTFGAYFFIISIQIIEEIASAILPGQSEILANLPFLIFSIILLIVVRFTERGLMEPMIENTKSMYELLMGK
ncbi:MAG: branched-chain amino acid ABC transporter permease [Promethearchaeota archaeon]|nr:MAG: branched-chain amino acid ABC transporter permease [Candidatus Lokiarchaeota archaeon]